MFSKCVAPAAGTVLICSDSCVQFRMDSIVNEEVAQLSELKGHVHVLIACGARHRDTVAPEGVHGALLGINSFGVITLDYK